MDDGDVVLYHGDVVETLRHLPAGVAQTCITSPPFYGLRDYGVDGQIGLEASVGEYVARLVEVFSEVWRVLRADGTCWIELGDSYHGGGYANHKINGEEWLHAHGGDRRQSRQQDRINAHPGLKPKDLYGVPWMVAFALRDAGWYLRSDIVWSRPNPMPESVTDRCTKSHSYLFLLAKQPRYYFDQDAIREPHAETQYSDAVNRPMWMARARPGDRGDARRFGNTTVQYNPAGRNRRSVWTIPTEPFPEAHFATYPQALVRPCILAGTSEKGECSACGAPWEREVERVSGDMAWSQSEQGATERQDAMVANGDRGGHGQLNRGSKEDYYANQPRNKTTGWRQSCRCEIGTMFGRMPPPRRPQTVIDPFIGSGTTALVARNHGRHAIGIDLSADYLQIAAKRLQQLSLLGGGS